MLAAGWPGPLVYRRPYPGSAVDTCTRPPSPTSASARYAGVVMQTATTQGSDAKHARTSPAHTAQLSKAAKTANIAELDRRSSEISLLREELRIKDARLGRILPARRPHYPSTERLAILALKAARGWNAEQAARACLVSEMTIVNWLRRIDEPGSDSHRKCDANVVLVDGLRLRVERLENGAHLPVVHLEHAA